MVDVVNLEGIYIEVGHDLLYLIPKKMIKVIVKGLSWVGVEVLVIVHLLRNLNNL